MKAALSIVLLALIAVVTLPPVASSQEEAAPALAYTSWYSLELEGSRVYGAVADEFQGAPLAVAVHGDDGYRVVFPGSNRGVREAVEVPHLWNPRVSDNQPLYYVSPSRGGLPGDHLVVAAGEGFIASYAVGASVTELWSNTSIGYEKIRVSDYAVAVAGPAERGIRVRLLNATNGVVFQEVSVGWADQVDYEIGVLSPYDGGATVYLAVASPGNLALFENGLLLVNITVPEELGAPRRILLERSVLDSTVYVASLYQFGFVVASSEGEWVNVTYDPGYHPYVVVDAAFGSVGYHQLHLAVLTKYGVDVFVVSNWTLVEAYRGEEGSGGLTITPRISWARDGVFAVLLGEPQDELVVKVFRVNGTSVEEVELDPPPSTIGSPSGIATLRGKLIVLYGYYDAGEMVRDARKASIYVPSGDRFVEAHTASFQRAYTGAMYRSGAMDPYIFLWNDYYFVAYEVREAQLLQPDDPREYFASKAKPLAYEYAYQTQGMLYLGGDEAVEAGGARVVVRPLEIASASLFTEASDGKLVVEGVFIEAQIEVGEAQGGAMTLHITIPDAGGTINTVYNAYVEGDARVAYASASTGKLLLVVEIPDPRPGDTYVLRALAGPSPNDNILGRLLFRLPVLELTVSGAPQQTTTTTTTQAPETTTTTEAPEVIIVTTTVAWTPGETATGAAPTATGGEAPPPEAGVAGETGEEGGAPLAVVAAAAVVVIVAAALLALRR